MSISDSEPDGPLDRRAGEFVARDRAGVQPSCTEYAGGLTGRAAEIDNVFPARVELLGRELGRAQVPGPEHDHVAERGQLPADLKPDAAARAGHHGNR